MELNKKSISKVLEEVYSSGSKDKIIKSGDYKEFNPLRYLSNKYKYSSGSNL